MKHIFSKKNRALLAEMVRTDFKLRYQGSVLGYAWSLLRPLLLFLILYIVFVKFLRLGSDVENYPIYLLLGIVLWSFFSEMTSQSLSAVVGRGDLIRKIRIPRWIIIVSTSIASLINLSLNLVVVAVFMLISGVDLTKTGLLFPLFVIEIYLLALGVSLILSAAFVKYRDVSYIWEVVLQAGFYVTPILYPLTIIVNETYQRILLTNPIAQAMQDARYVLVTKESITMGQLFANDWVYIVPLGIIAVTLLGGVWYFKKEAQYYSKQ